MIIRSLTLTVALTLSSFLNVVALAADGPTVIRLVNSTGQTLERVAIMRCSGGAPVYELDRGESVAPSDVRFWNVAPGCYIVHSGTYKVKVTVKKGYQHDAALF